MTDSDVSRIPPTVNLELYAGDGVAIRFSLATTDSAAYPLDGVVISQIKAKRTDPDPLVSWNVDASELAQGIVTLSLSGDQTASLIPSGKTVFHGVWDLQYTPTDAEPVTFMQGNVKCEADVTH